MKVRKPTLNQSGYTIVELIVSITVFAILVGSANAILSTHAYLSQKGRDLVLANAYAELKIESLRSHGFLGLTDGTTTLTSELPAELSSPRSASQVISTYIAGVKQIVINISYNEQGKSKTVTYKSYIGELGVGQY